MNGAIMIMVIVSSLRTDNYVFVLCVFFFFFGAFPGSVNAYFFLMPKRITAVLACSFDQPCTS